MTIDERLERLAERHASMMRFLEKSSREHDLRVAEFKRRFAENERSFPDNNRCMAEIMEGITRLVCTVQQEAGNIQVLVRLVERSA
jgi:molybdopterin-biosynthesis enzyme MoeA-like protein